jgi:phage terminase large subunit-like protein
MSPAVDIVERVVIQRKLRHGAHPVLQWCAANAVVTQIDGPDRRASRARHGAVARASSGREADRH